MTKTRCQIFALTVVLCAVGAATVVAHADGDKTDPALKEIAGYKQWPRATGQPQPIENFSAAG